MLQNNTWNKTNQNQRKITSSGYLDTSEEGLLRIANLEYPLIRQVGGWVYIELFIGTSFA